MKELLRKLSIMAGALCLMLAGVILGGITGSAKPYLLDPAGLPDITAKGMQIFYISTSLVYQRMVK